MTHYAARDTYSQGRFSERQYKYRIKTWDLEKKMKAPEVAEMVQLHDQRLAIDKETEFTIRGKKITWSKVERYLKRSSKSIARPQRRTDQPSRSSIICRTPSPEPCFPVPPLTTTMPRLPDDLQALENISRLCHAYVYGEDIMASGRNEVIWIQEWAWGFAACSTTLTGTLVASEQFKRLNRLLDSANGILRSNDLNLPVAVLMLWNWTISRPSKIFESTWKFLRQLAAVIHPPLHPLVLLFQYLSTAQVSNADNIGLRVREVLSATITDNLGKYSQILGRKIQARQKWLLEVGEDIGLQQDEIRQQRTGIELQREEIELRREQAGLRPEDSELRLEHSVLRQVLKLRQVTLELQVHADLQSEEIKLLPDDSELRQEVLALQQETLEFRQEMLEQQRRLLEQQRQLLEKDRIIVQQEQEYLEQADALWIQARYSRQFHQEELKERADRWMLLWARSRLVRPTSSPLLDETCRRETV